MQEQREDDQRGRRIAVGGGIVALILILIALLWALKDGAAPSAPPEPAAPAVATSSGDGTLDDTSAPAGAETAAATPPSSPPAAPGTSSGAAETPAEAPVPVPPSFDVARIAPDGTAVLAGRTPAGSTVDVLGNGAAIGSAKGEGGDGAWALVVDKPLPEGTLELSLVATMPDGNRIPSTEVVLVDVPSRTKPPALAEGGS
ncbi:MAG: hypothetical protein PHS60_16425, partial [Zavarzinia sp.]|nr:hypothetical protein [Zavarzinia sp.]